MLIDAGIATALNIKWLKENKYHYIAVNRGSAPLDLDYTQMEVIKEDETKGIKIEVKRLVYGPQFFISNCPHLILFFIAFMDNL